MLFCRRLWSSWIAKLRCPSSSDAGASRRKPFLSCVAMRRGQLVTSIRYDTPTLSNGITSVTVVLIGYQEQPSLRIAAYPYDSMDALQPTQSLRPLAKYIHRDSR